MSSKQLFSRLKKQGVKLHLVEDNLKITAPEGKLTPALLAEIKQHKNEITEFLKKHIQKQEKFATIEPAAESPYYPLSYAQERLFIVQRMMERNISYNLPGVMELIGAVEKEKIATVFRGLIERHESLRTSFHLEAGQPVQKIHIPEEIEFVIEYIDLAAGEEKGDRQKYDDMPNLSYMSYSAPESANESSPHHSSFMIHNSILKFIRPFDLSKAPLLRVGFIKKGEEKHLFMVDMHHIISDGTSIGILTGEFAALYAGEEVPPLRLQYKDYAVWQRSDRQVEAVKEQERFWLGRFAGELPLLNLPMDYPRPPVQDFKGSALYFEIEKEQVKALNTLAKAEDATLYIVLLAVYNVFLSKICGQEDIIVGTPTAGRRHADIHHIIGMFVNTLALRNYPTGGKTFREFLKEVKSVTLTAFENQDYPFEKLVEKVTIERDISRNPLFDTMFALQNMDMSTDVLTVLQLSPYEFEAGIVKFDLALDFLEKGGVLEAKIDYSTALFKRETIERFSFYFREIVSAVLEEPGRELRRIEMITGAEKERILYDFNDTQVDYPRDKTIHELFARQAGKTPGSTAVVGIEVGEGGSGYKEKSLTYRELDEESGDLAALLIEKGAAPGAIVGIMIEPGVEMAAGLLAILKAGGAYLPIDPGYPAERKRYMLADSGSKLLLTTVGLKAAVDHSSVKEVEIVILDFPVKGKEKEKLKRSLHISYMSYSSYMPSPSPLAYIMYTSGSTGRPKGVMVEHRGVVRLVKKPNFIDFQEGKRLLMTGAPVFDITTLEIWGPLLNGLGLYAVSRQIIMDGKKLQDAVVNNGITILHLIPQLFNQLLEQNPDMFAGLEYFLVGGDLVKPGPVIKLRNMYDHIKIVHCYGPTENTTFSTTFPVEKDYKERLPIGRPINNSSVYILDKYRKLQPIGIPGELYVGGDGVARGYLNNPDLSAEKFIGGAAHPLSGELASRSSPLTLYRTGDLACWLPDGNIKFLGRIDHQVKVRGVRIELGEVENRLKDHENIEEAVVIARTDKSGDKYLCAYVLAGSREQEAGIAGDSGEGPASLNLRQYLAARLPDYMAPSYFVFLDKLPLNPNGKVDIKALPEPEIGEPGVEYAAPRDEVEKTLVEIWSETLALEKEKIGIDADFFRLGGHSLKAAIMAAAIAEKFAVEISLVEIFKTPTIRTAAALIKAVNWANKQEARENEESEELIL